MLTPANTPVVFETALPITLQNATRSAAFRLQLPSGLPEGTRLLRLDAASKPGTNYIATYLLSNAIPYNSV